MVPLISHMFGGWGWGLGVGVGVRVGGGGGGWGWGWGWGWGAGGGGWQWWNSGVLVVNLIGYYFEDSSVTYVDFILTYALWFWGAKKFPFPDAIQNRAITMFLGVYRFASNLAINGDISWRSAYIKQRMWMLRLWNKLCCLGNHRLCKKVFDWIMVFSNIIGPQRQKIFSWIGIKTYLIQNLYWYYTCLYWIRGFWS